MEEHIQEVKIYKDGELVATAEHVKVVKVPMPQPDKEKLPVTYTCYHMPQIKLERIFIFRVLNKQPMTSIFNESGMEIDGERVEPLYLVHSTVETFRGNPHISSVVLSKPNVPVSKEEFVLGLPDLYRRFSALI